MTPDFIPATARDRAKAEKRTHRCPRLLPTADTIGDLRRCSCGRWWVTVRYGAGDYGRTLVTDWVRVRPWHLDARRRIRAARDAATRRAAP